MKKVLSLVLCLALILGLASISAAAAGEPTVRVGSAQAAAGETVTLDVAVENDPGIFALTFSFNYDTSRLKLTAVTPNKTDFPGSWQAGSLKGATWASNAGDITANGTILTMSFEVLADAAPGDAEVEVILGEIINEAMDDIEFSSVPGKIAVSGSGETPEPSDGPTVRVGSAQAAAGETVTLDVAVENDPGIFALTFSFRYDTSRLKLTAVTPNKTDFPGTWQAGGLKGATWASNAGDITANGTILTMSFEVLADAAPGEAEVEVILGEIINEAMDDIEFSSIPGTVTVTESASSSAQVYGSSISLKGNIGLNFYVILPEAVSSDADAYVTLNETQYPIAEASTRVVGELTLYQFSFELPAKCMNDVVTLRVFDGEGNRLPLFRYSDGKDMSENGYRTSVQEYIQKTKETSTDEELLALLDAMSDYGSMAQLQFSYNADTRVPVKADLSQVTVEDLSGYDYTITPGKYTGVSFSSASLSLQSETVLRIYLKLDEGEIGDYTFKLGTKEVQPYKSGSYWIVEISNIAAKDLDRLYTVTVTSASGKVLTVKACALGYCYRVLASDRTSDTLKDTVRAIYLYNQAANAYFG